MSAHHLQGSLFDQADELRLGLLDGLRRTEIGLGAWIDVLPGWLGGAYGLFERPAAEVPWRDALSAHYRGEPGEPFTRAGLCYYRDGRDSVARHGDRVGRHGDRVGRGAREDTVVAILSVGAPRDVLLRPAGGGGTTLRRPLGHGDLIVMGGSCRRTWEHCVPRAPGPRHRGSASGSTRRACAEAASG